MRIARLIATAVLVGIVLWVFLVAGNVVKANGDAIFADSFGDDPCDGCGAGQEPPPLDCAAIAAEHGFQREQRLGVFINPNIFESRDATTLRGLYGGKVTTTKVHWELRAGRYVAFAMTGAELEVDLPGRTSYAPGGEPQNGEPMTGFTSMTISLCPGDFRFTGDAPGQICRGTSRANVNDIVYFDIADQAARSTWLPNACTIDRSSTYYLNVVFADARDGLEPFELSCPDGETRCGWRWNIE